MRSRISPVVEATQSTLDTFSFLRQQKQNHICIELELYSELLHYFCRCSQKRHQMFSSKYKCIWDIWICSSLWQIIDSFYCFFKRSTFSLIDSSVLLKDNGWQSSWSSASEERYLAEKRVYCMQVLSHWALESILI